MLHRLDKIGFQVEDVSHIFYNIEVLPTVLSLCSLSNQTRQNITYQFNTNHGIMSKRGCRRVFGILDQPAKSCMPIFCSKRKAIGQLERRILEKFYNFLLSF